MTSLVWGASLIAGGVTISRVRIDVRIRRRRASNPRTYWAIGSRPCRWGSRKRPWLLGFVFFRVLVGPCSFGCLTPLCGWRVPCWSPAWPVRGGPAYPWPLSPCVPSVTGALLGVGVALELELGRLGPISLEELTFTMGGIKVIFTLFRVGGIYDIITMI